MAILMKCCALPRKTRTAPDAVRPVGPFSAGPKRPGAHLIEDRHDRHRISPPSRRSPGRFPRLRFKPCRTLALSGSGHGSVVLVWTYLPLLQPFELSFLPVEHVAKGPRRSSSVWTNYRNLLGPADIAGGGEEHDPLHRFGLLPLSVGIPLAVAILTGGTERTAAATSIAPLIFVPMIVAPDRRRHPVAVASQRGPRRS